LHLDSITHGGDAAPFLVHEIPASSSGDALGGVKVKTLEYRRAERAGRRRAAHWHSHEGQVVELGDAHDDADGRRRFFLGLGN
jgi:hypothetical protein